MKPRPLLLDFFLGRVFQFDQRRFGSVGVNLDRSLTRDFLADEEFVVAA